MGSHNLTDKELEDLISGNSSENLCDEEKNLEMFLEEYEVQEERIGIIPTLVFYDVYLSWNLQKRSEAVYFRLDFYHYLRQRYGVERDHFKLSSSKVLLREDIITIVGIKNKQMRYTNGNIKKIFKRSKKQVT